MTLSLNLPKPISANRLFANKARGRRCTEAYSAWKWQAKAMLQSQKPFDNIDGPVRILFAVGEVGLRKDMDGDNTLKCMLDALVDCGVLLDDKRGIVRSVGMVWVIGKEGATAHISPAKQDEAAEAISWVPYPKHQIRGTIS
jgi:Holliday junction resolvase RusA-like endonuclease